jgi:hypothetical protein
MLQFKPVRLDFEKTFVTRELFRRVAGRFQRQTLFGVIFDFFQQILHGRTVAAVCGHRNYFGACRMPLHETLSRARRPLNSSDAGQTRS